MNDKSRRIAYQAGLVFLTIAIFLLPITSLPALSRLAGGTRVAPPSLLLYGLAFMAFIFSRGKQIRWFSQGTPLLWFLASSFFSLALSFFREFPPFRQISPLRESVWGLVTLLAGIVVYLSLVFIISSRQHLRLVFAAIQLGGLAVIVWSLLQVWVLFAKQGSYPAWMEMLHNWLSVNPLVEFATMKRATGFAFEPSWLAHQLNLVYLPYWFAASITGYSLFPSYRFITFERILAVLGIVVLVSSISRIGILTQLLVFGYFLLHFTFWVVNRLRTRYAFLPVLGVTLGLGAIYLAAGAGLLYSLSFLDDRLRAIFTLKELPPTWFSLASQLRFAERIVYWTVGLYAFAHYPIFGVGLGNAGFFFSEAIPPVSRSLVEMVKIEWQSLDVPSVKNLWLRLLSETGLVGFGLFLAWLVLLWKATRTLMCQNDLLYRLVGWMGLLSLIALIGEGFSVDSFALPYLWTMAGILTATFVLWQKETQD